MAIYKLLDKEKCNEVSEMCYDYLRAYLDFYNENQAIAKEVVEKYSDAKLPAAKRKLFEDFEAALNELGR